MSGVVFFQECNWEPWKNGLGLTRVLGGNTLWRLSLADIRTSSSFSIFEGQTREIGLVHGHGLTLRPDNPALPPLVLGAAGVCLRFSGDLALAGQLHDGPVQVLNLMYGARRRYALRPLTQAGRVHDLLALVPVRGVWRTDTEQGREEGSVAAAGYSFLCFSTPRALVLAPQEADAPLAYGVFATPDAAA